jgi:hypothetical protein
VPGEIEKRHTNAALDQVMKFRIYVIHFEIVLEIQTYISRTRWPMQIILLENPDQMHLLLCIKIHALKIARAYSDWSIRNAGKTSFDSGSYGFQSKQIPLISEGMHL